jgi:hypothetical protein
MNLLPPSSVWTFHRTLQIWNFNIILTYKNVQQCSISFVVRDSQESWDSHNCKLMWIKCFKEVRKNKILKAILCVHIQLKTISHPTMKINCSNSLKVLQSLIYTSVVCNTRFLIWILTLSANTVQFTVMAIWHIHCKC